MKLNIKKYLFLLCTSFTFGLAQAQEIKDAIRYAQDNLNGTARFRAMGGAFGALGGDLSAISINPAGSAVFANHQIAITLSSVNTRNNSNYFGTKTSDTDNSFGINQTGGVFVFKNPTSNWKKIALAINYEKTNNFDNSVYSAGVNPNNSVDAYFLNYAEGVPLNILEDSYYDELDYGAQQAFLGYQSYLINPNNDSDPNNDQYNSNVTPGGRYYQENTVRSSGSNGKLSFNFATSYKDKIYIGASLNSHFVNYTQTTKFYERNSNPLTSDYTVTKVNFNNNLYTYGSGFSLQLGAIAKITEAFRIGLAYESPSWYQLNEEFSQEISAVSANDSEVLAPDTTNPDVINYYDPYNLQTPGKFNFSLAYIVGKSGLISIDYGVKDYRNTKFKSTDNIDFSDLNRQMKTTLNYTNELRIGGEYKIKALSIRGGYRFEQSPYKNKKTISDLNSFSGGLGYDFGMFKLDLAYTHAQRSSQQGFFDQGLTDTAKINTSNNNFTTTLLFNL